MDLKQMDFKEKSMKDFKEKILKDFKEIDLEKERF